MSASVLDAPLTIQVEDPINNMMILSGQSQMETVVNRSSWVTVGTKGSVINTNDFITKMTGLSD